MFPPSMIAAGSVGAAIHGLSNVPHLDEKLLQKLQEITGIEVVSSVLFCGIFKAVYLKTFSTFETDPHTPYHHLISTLTEQGLQNIFMGNAEILKTYIDNCGNFIALDNGISVISEKKGSCVD